MRLASSARSSLLAVGESRESKGKSALIFNGELLDDVDIGFDLLCRPTPPSIQ